MRFDRGLRNAMMRPYPAGYEAASTKGFNTEDPLCVFGGAKDTGEWLGEEDLPSMIELHVRLTPVWVDNGTASSKLGDNKVCSLYPPQTTFSKIKIIAMGGGQYQKASGNEKIPFMGASFLHYSLDLPQPCLYEKTFLVQPEGRHIHWIPQGVLFLWAYGGAQMGDDVHPLVVTLEAIRDQTILKPTSLLSWREQDIFPGSEEVIFQDIFEEEETRTLMESIEVGRVKINLTTGVDEKGNLVKVPYHSYQLLKDSLFFKKGG